MTKLPYSSVILCDTEFELGGVEGNLSRPVCVVVKRLSHRPGVAFAAR